MFLPHSQYEVPAQGQITVAAADGRGKLREFYHVTTGKTSDEEDVDQGLPEGPMGKTSEPRKPLLIST